MSEWRTVPAGSVLSQIKDSVEIDPAVPQLTMGIRYGVGAFPREPRPVAAKRLFRGSAGQFMFSRIDTQRGAFACIPEELDGHLVTNEFPLYAPTRTGELDVRFLLLYFRQQSVLDEIDQVRAGSEGRSRWKEADFEAWRIPLPPLAEQRRIVDVMAAVDAQIEALEAEAAALSSAVGPMTESLLAGDLDWPIRALGEVGEFIRGRRFVKNDYVSDGLGVIHYSHIHTHFGPVCREVVARVPEAMSSRLRLAHTGDVIIAATSEDLAGVGKATVWLGDEEVAVHDDAQIYRHSLDPLFASFVFASPAFQAQKVQYAGGTKVTRISGADMAKISVPIPPANVQQRVGKALADAARQAESVAQEARDLREIRSTLLTALLSQQVEIPESYDALVDDAVEVFA